MAVEELGQMPEITALMRRAATGALTRAVGPHPKLGPGALAGELLVRDVAIDADHLSRYTRVCGFRLSNVLPPTYPHIMAFPLGLELMTRRDFPFPLLGLVHIQNTIEHLRPVRLTERLDLMVRAENLRHHERGRAIDLVTTAIVDGEPVWRERSTYLRRSAREAPSRISSGAASAGGMSVRTEAPAATAIWRVPASIGSSYAAISGDRNPIHTSSVAARLFGFRGRIAHGMWTKARSLAALEGRLPETYTVDVSFKLPVVLPATVAYSASRRTDGGWQFSLRDAASTKPHLVGSVEPTITT